MRKILEGLGLEIATPDEAREILSLKGGDKVEFLDPGARAPRLDPGSAARARVDCRVKPGNDAEVRQSARAHPPRIAPPEFINPPQFYRCVLPVVPPIGSTKGGQMASIDSVSITILFGAVLVLAGIMSSLVALRFGAPLLLVFLLVGMLAGESGIGGIKFDDVRLAYTVGSVALGLILFDGGLRTRLATFRNVLAPAGLLATAGVLITAALTAPVAVWALQLNWSEALLVGAVMASTDAAAVFFLLHAKGLRLRPARQRDAGGRIRHQRSVRDLSHHRPGRDPVRRPELLARHRPSAGREGDYRRLPRLGRWPRHDHGAQPARTAAGHACRRSSPPARW